MDGEALILLRRGDRLGEVSSRHNAPPCGLAAAGGAAGAASGFVADQISKSRNP